MDYLSWPDYLILVAFFVISIGIGVYHSLTGGRQKTTAEFIMANRSLKVLPTSLSLLVSIQSAIMILGVTAEVYSYGSLYIVWTLVSITIAIIVAMQVAVPWLYPLKLVSVNEYFQRRFHSKSVRIFAATTSIFSAILYMGTAMYAPSAALQSATGVPILFSIPVMAVVSVVYTALGGIKAVVWTDVFQSFIMFGGLLAILIKGLIVVGGFSSVIELCSQTGRMNWIDWSPDPTVRHTFWGFLIGYSLSWINYYGVSQASVQRYSATKSQSQARLTIFLNLPAYIILHLLISFNGLVVVSYYTSIRCDPLANGDIGSANQLLPRFVLQMFADAPGFAGIFLAALYGGALSSVSTSLSGSAAMCWEDILQWKLKHWTESRKALLNRFLVVMFGIAATGLAFTVSVVPGPISQIVISLLNATSGPIYGLFILGGLNRYANWKGALIGGITSAIFSFWLVLGSMTTKRKHPTFPPLSIDGCTKFDDDLTFPRFNDTNSSSIFHFLDQSPVNTTMTYFRPLTNETIEIPLQGLERFYSISYLWYGLLCVLVTVVVGSVSSFLLKDRTLEEKFDEKLLFNFIRCSRCGDSVTKSDAASEISSPDENWAEGNELLEEPVKPHLKRTSKEEEDEVEEEEEDASDKQEALGLTNGKSDALDINAEMSSL